MSHTEMQPTKVTTFIKSLPSVKTECSICFHTRWERGVQLPCGHEFGKKCMTDWFQAEEGNAGTCPHCRRVLFLKPDKPPQKRSGWTVIEWWIALVAIVVLDILAIGHTLGKFFGLFGMVGVGWWMDLIIVVFLTPLVLFALYLDYRKR